MGNTRSRRAPRETKSNQVVHRHPLSPKRSSLPAHTHLRSDANATIYVSKKDPYSNYKEHLKTHIKDKGIREEVDSMQEADQTERPALEYDVYS